MSIKYIKGDATDPQSHGSKVLIHICNDMGKWGKGFVLALSKRYPITEECYRKWYRDDVDIEKFALGNIQLVKVDNNKKIVVINMIAQHGLKGGSKGPPIRYEALADCLKKVRKIVINMKNTTIHMSRIGCGLGGGSWDKVEQIILDQLKDIDITVYDQ